MFSVFLISTMFKTVPTQAAPEDIKIGIIGPVGLPQWSPAGMKEGAELAAMEINDAGGVNIGGTYRNITLVEGNECSFPSIDVAEAQAEVVRLYDEGCRIMIGGFRTEVTGPMSDIAMWQAEPVIFLINGASPDELISDRVPVNYPVYKYLFRIMPTNLTTHLYTLAVFNQYVLASLAPIYGDYLWPEAPNPQIRVAVLTEELDWTLPMHQYLTNPSIYPGLLGPYANVTYADRVPEGATDLSSYIGNIISSEARIVIHVFYGVAGVQFSAQWGATNVNASLVGINTMAQLQSHWEATGGLCELETVICHFGTRTPIVPGLTEMFWDNFLDYTEQKYGTPKWPTSTAFGAYKGIYTVKEAIEAAGTTDSDAVVSALETQERMSLNGIAKFTASSIPHDVFCNSIGPTWSSPQYTRAFMVQWVAGKLEVVWPIDQSYSKEFLSFYGELCAPHDVAVTDSSTCCGASVVHGGSICNINVTVENQGGSTETFDIFVYDDEPVFPTFGQKEIFWSMGDVNHDGYINETDAELIGDHLGSDDPQYDINTDGHVDMSDMIICASNVGMDIWRYFGLPPPIGVHIVTLASGNSSNMVFTWNTTDLTEYEYYNLTSCAQMHGACVLGDVDIADNTLIHGDVLVVHEGDWKGDPTDGPDGKVRVDDILAIALIFGTDCGDLEFDPNADTNCDAKIRVDDILATALQFGWG